jgi:hypothetical protein
MRPDQTEKLNDLTGDLMDVFLTEADPTNWTGAGQTQAEMEKETRGARNWDMKNANQAGALLARALDLRDRLQGVTQPNTPPVPDDAAEADIARFERQAKEMIKQVTEKRSA